MKRSILYIAITAVIMTASIYASAADKKSDRRQWTKEMLEYKHDFIAQETDMTQAQRDKFMPLYEAMEKEIYAVNREAREQAQKVSAGNKVTDQDYDNAARAMSAVKVKEGEIESKYFNKFSLILSKKQMFLLKQAERKFTRQMISRGKKK